MRENQQVTFICTLCALFYPIAKKVLLELLCSLKRDLGTNWMIFLWSWYKRLKLHLHLLESNFGKLLCIFKLYLSFSISAFIFEKERAIELPWKILVLFTKRSVTSISLLITIQMREKRILNVRFVLNEKSK